MDTNAIRREILNVAIDHLGYKEMDHATISEMSHRTKFNDWMGSAVDNWSGCFVSYCYNKAGLLIKFDHEKGINNILAFNSLLNNHSNKITKNPKRCDLVVSFRNGIADNIGLYMKQTLMDESQVMILSKKGKEIDFYDLPKTEVKFINIID